MEAETNERPDKKISLEQLRGSKPVQALDKGIEALDRFLGPSGKAWLANGLEELRQGIALGGEQVQGGNNPGLWGTITTGEATAERMGELSLDDLRGSAGDRAKGTEPSTDRDAAPEPGQERGTDRGRIRERGQER